MNSLIGESSSCWGLQDLPPPFLVWIVIWTRSHNWLLWPQWMFENRDGEVDQSYDLFWCFKVYEEALKFYTPLSELRLADANRNPLMAFVYYILEAAKSDIKVACNQKDNTFRWIIDIINKEFRDRLDSIIHVVLLAISNSYVPSCTRTSYDPIWLWISCSGKIDKYNT